MAVAVRPADLDADREQIVCFLRSHLTAQSDTERFDWLYLRNPSGRARAWLAVDDSTSRTLGVAAAFPRLVWTEGRRQQAWILGDFCIEPQSRSLGPALQLQRACLAGLAKQGTPVWYDLPSRPMMAVYRRLGIPVIGHQVRYVKLNRIDTTIRHYIPQQALASSISLAGNFMLRLQSLAHRVPSSIEVSVHDAPFGPEFTAFDSVTAAFYPMRASRSAEYLNWRYMQNPLRRYQVIVARCGCELLGYAILEITGTDGVLADLQSSDDDATVAALLTYLDKLGRRFNLERLHAPIMQDSPLVPHLKRAGFRARESFPVVGRTVDFETSTAVLSGNRWCLMHGDRES
jgi:hypothetical protein